MCGIDEPYPCDLLMIYGESAQELTGDDESCHGCVDENMPPPTPLLVSTTD